MADLIVGKKMQDKMASSMNESRAAPMGRFGAKMLEKMGWKEGDGLGKNSDGMKEHIKIKKREESIGLGADKVALEQSNPAEGWWMDAYSTSIKNMKGNKKKEEKKKEKDKKEKKRKRDKNGHDSDSEEASKDLNHPTFDDLFKATGGVRLGMRARGDQSAKFRRTEGEDAVTGAKLDMGKESIIKKDKKNKKEKKEKKDKKDKKEKKEKKEKKKEK